MSALITRVLVSAGMAAAFSGSVRADDEQGSPPHFVFDQVKSSTTVANPHEFLTLIDGPAGGGAATSGRLRHYNFNGADIGLAFDLTRLSSKYRPEPGAGSDRYKIVQVGVLGRIPVSDGLDLQMVGDLAHRRQQLRTVPTSYDKGQTYAARAGLGVAGDDWSVTALYETVQSKSRNGPIDHRMAELLGGAPLNRDGVSFAVQRDFALKASSRLSLRLIGGAMHGSARDRELIGASKSGRTERLALLKASLVF